MKGELRTSGQTYRFESRLVADTAETTTTPSASCPHKEKKGWELYFIELIECYQVPFTVNNLTKEVNFFQ